MHGRGKAHLVSALRGKKKRGSYKVIVTADENKAKEWVENYRFFGEDAVYFPAKDPLFYSADVHEMPSQKSGSGGSRVLSRDREASLSCLSTP